MSLQPRQLRGFFSKRGATSEVDAAPFEDHVCKGIGIITCWGHHPLAQAAPRHHGGLCSCAGGRRRSRAADVMTRVGASLQVPDERSRPPNRESLFCGHGALMSGTPPTRGGRAPNRPDFSSVSATKSQDLDRLFLKRRGPSMPWHEHPPRYDRRRKARSALARRRQCIVLLSR